VRRPKNEYPLGKIWANEVLKAHNKGLTPRFKNEVAVACLILLGCNPTETPELIDEDTEGM